jgi:hypothetical protein
MKRKQPLSRAFVFCVVLMSCGGQAAAQENDRPYYNDLNEFILHRAQGLTTMSSFYSPGSQWCTHPYVRVVAEYETDAIRQSILTSNPATYLQQTVIPEIKKICPTFPHAAKYHKQVIDFRFRPKDGGIADERINPDKLGFQIDDNGNVVLAKDITYQNWKDPGKGTYAFEREQQASGQNQALIAGVETLMEAVNLAIQNLEKPLQSALQRRETYQLAFATTADPIFFEAINLNEDAITNFQSALTQNRKALSSLKAALSQYSDPSGSDSNLERGSRYMNEYKKHREQAKSFETTAWDKALEGDTLFKEGRGGLE